MLGLVLLAILAAHVIVFFLIRWVCRKLAKNLPWRVAQLGLWAVPWLYLVWPFWDWAPNALLHSYYCRTQAYIRIYQTEQEWLAANADRLDQLVLPPFGSEPKTSGTVGQWSWILVNRSVVSLRYSQPVGPHFLSAWKHEYYIYDLSARKLILGNVDFSVGSNFIVHGGSPQYHAASCFTQPENNSTYFHELFMERPPYRSSR